MTTTADALGSRTHANAAALRKLAEETGLNIILGVGVYRDPYIDRAWLDRVGADALAEILVRDLTDEIPAQ